MPFWKADAVNRDFHFAEKVGLFLKEAEERLESPGYRDLLMKKYFMKETAAEETVAFLKLQVEAAGTSLPHRHNILIEHYDDPGNRSDSKQVVLHTVWGGKVNTPLSLALAAAWEEKYGYKLEIFSNNDAILLMLPHSFRAEDLFGMVTGENLEAMLRKKLESTGFFGARFRMNAGVALLLPRGGFKKRLPLWFNRLRSKKLMDAVKKYSDFPILLETWRNCLRDEFDLKNLLMLLEEIREGKIKITETVTRSPSPFAGGLIWRQTDKYMYQDDTPFSETASDLSGELIRKIIASDELRPRISSALLESFRGKIRRTAKDYSPSTAEELIEHVKERLLVPREEWELLMSAMERDHGERPDLRSGILPRRVVMVKLPGSDIFSAAAIEMLPFLAESLELEREDLNLEGIAGEVGVDFSENEKLLKRAFSGYKKDESPDSGRTEEGVVIQFLSFYGPVEPGFVGEIFGFSRGRLLALFDSLLEENLIVEGEISDRGNGGEICHGDNLEILIRISRREREPRFEAREITELPLFLAAYQGVADIRGDGESPPEGERRFMDKLKGSFEKLFGYPAAASAWEDHIIPARLNPYFTAWLDSLMQTTGLTWFGCGNRKLGFALQEDLDLFLKRSKGKDEKDGPLLPEMPGRYTLFDVMKAAGLGRVEARDALWKSAWKSRVSSDSFETVRIAILNKFNPNPHALDEGVVRAFTGKWDSKGPVGQYWYSLRHEGGERDLMEEEELNRERVRQLFARYGILFRELLAYEQDAMKWGKLFRTLRLMELSGEVLSGHFFKGIAGLQFISHEAFRFLREFRDEGRIFWLNAADPASLCGIKVEELKAYLPARFLSTFLVFHGEKLVMKLMKNCKEVEILTGPGDENIPVYFRFFTLLLTRDFHRVPVIYVNKINGKPARKSEYTPLFTEFGFTGEYNSLMLVRKYQA
jgi:ATP-dependent Lhr-like helicase